MPLSAKDQATFNAIKDYFAGRFKDGHISATLPIRNEIATAYLHAPSNRYGSPTTQTSEHSEDVVSLIEVEFVKKSFLVTYLEKVTTKRCFNGFGWIHEVTTTTEMKIRFSRKQINDQSYKDMIANL